MSKSLNKVSVMENCPVSYKMVKEQYTDKIQHQTVSTKSYT